METGMNKRLKTLLKLAVIICGLYMVIIVCTAKKGLPPIEERVYGVSQIWKKAADHYALWEMADTDPSWDEAYEIAYKEAVESKTAKDYYLTLKKFLAHLHDGHADTISANSIVRKYKLPFYMEYQDNQYVVTQVMNAHASKFPLGSVVKTINGVETGTYLENKCGEYVGLLTPGARQQMLCQLFMYIGNQRDKIKVEIQYPGELGTKVETAAWSGSSSKYQKLSYDIEGETIYNSHAFDVKITSDNYAYINFKTQQDVAYVDEFFDKVAPLIEECKGIVLDVRSNGGGNSSVGHKILEGLMGEPIVYNAQSVSTIKVSDYVNNYGFWKYYLEMAENTSDPTLSEQIQRTINSAKGNASAEWDAIMEIGNEMYNGRYELSEEMVKVLEDDLKERYPEVWKESKEREPNSEGGYDHIYKSQLVGKEVVILIGPHSGSATDTMAAIAKHAGFTLLGTRTKGATGNVLSFDVGGGWQARISTQRGLTPEGIDINNVGIEADIVTEQKVEDSVKGIDTQVEAALALLRE